MRLHRFRPDENYSTLAGRFLAASSAWASGSRRSTATARAGFTCDNRDTAWKLYAGGRFSRYFGLEFGYNDFGKVDQSGGRTKAFAANITFTAGIPIGDRFDIFAKGGGAYGRTDVSVDASTGLASGTKSNFEGTYGVGASYAITRHWQVRADWDRYNLDFVGQGKQNVDMATASLQYRF